MQDSYTRQEFYDLVWSKPMTTIAEQMGCSSVWLGKVCRENNIPVPERGYWARHAAGKPTIKRSLAPRFPGASNIVIGGDTGFRGGLGWKEEMLSEPIPSRPTFEEDINDVRARIEKMVGKVTCPKDFTRAHRLITKLLEQNVRRRERFPPSSPFYGSSVFGTNFDGTLERRWLRIVNAIFVALERCGCKTTMPTSEYAALDRELRASVGNERIHFKLAIAKPARGRAASTKQQDRLRFVILRSSGSESVHNQWQDTDDARLESILTTIVIEIILAAEVFCREATFRHHDWWIKRRAELEEEERQRKIEEERRARALLEKQRQERIDRMLQQAALFNQAATIRQLVQTIRDHAADIGAADEDIQAWASWAIEQADTLDPAKNGTAAAMIAELPKETR